VDICFIHKVVSEKCVNYFSRKVFQPELDTPSQDTTVPRLSSTNLSWKEVTEQTVEVAKIVTK